MSSQSTLHFKIDCLFVKLVTYVYRAPTANVVKIWEIWEFFYQEYGRFMGFFNKNMGEIWEKLGFIRPKLTLKTNLNLNVCT